MKTTPIYLKSLKLSNIKTFGENVELKLSKEDGSIPQWTLILGDNGIGKSTLLQCIAWMKPYFPDPKIQDGPLIPLRKIETGINDEENNTIISLVRDTNVKEKKAKVQVSFVTQEGSFAEPKNLGSQKLISDLKITLKGDDMTDFKTNIKVGEDEIFFYKNEIHLIAYSATRKLGKLNVYDERLENRFALQDFTMEKSELFDVEQILHDLKYGAYEAKDLDSDEFNKYDSFLTAIKRMLVKVCPDIEDERNIHINAPRLVGKKLIPGEVLITTKHGVKLPFNDFSLGYKTTISWTVDLAWRLFNIYAGNNPLEQPAIVLIDEIDLHLHPIWQREIIQNLSQCFPAVQFIATAHSPIMIQASNPLMVGDKIQKSCYSVVHFSKELNEARVENNPEKVNGWKIGQVLKSIFGISSDWGPTEVALIEERNEILSKKSRSHEDKERLDEIGRLLSGFQVVDDLSDQNLLNQIREAANLLRKEGKL